MSNQHFDYLICVIFKEDFTVHSGYQIPHKIVIKHAKYFKHTNSYKLILTDSIKAEKGVIDISKRFIRLERSLN